MKRSPVITYSRLFAAADHLLDAMNSRNGANAMVSVRLDDDPPSTGRAPIYGFTKRELVEAMSMLMRMGFARPGDFST